MERGIRAYRVGGAFLDGAAMNDAHTQGSTRQGTQDEHPAESAGLNPYTMGLDTEPESADWRSLVDILRLLVFAVLLRLAEAVTVERDTPGWWRNREQK